MSSSILLWDIIKNNHCFLMKRKGITFSRDPLNLRSKNCFMYCGLVHKKALGLKVDKDGKGVILSHKRFKRSENPAKSVTTTKFVRGKRRTLQKIRNFIVCQGYRRELKMLALRRASGLMKNLKLVKPPPVKTKKATS